MKKTIVTLTTLALLVGGTPAFAQTTSSTTTQKITDYKNALILLKSLREGMSGDEVKLLQAALAADPSIYPEGKVTGYYGKLTREAVKRLQKSRGISGNGTIVGPLTLPHVNDILFSAPISHERDEDNDDGDRHGQRKKEEKKLCIKLPPGQLTAPGLHKSRDDDDHDGKGERGARGKGKWDWNESKLERCKEVGNGTTTPPVVTPPADVAAPIITGAVVNTTSSTTANVLWTTNELATTKVYYGTANPLILGSAMTIGTTTLSTAHMVTLTGLTASTTYYSVVQSLDAANNTATSSQLTFTTPL